MYLAENILPRQRSATTAVCLFVKVCLAEVYGYAPDCERDLGFLRAILMITLLSGRRDLSEMLLAPESVADICRNDFGCLVWAPVLITLYNS